MLDTNNLKASCDNFIGKLLSRTGQVSVRDNNFPIKLRVTSSGDLIGSDPKAATDA